MDRKFVAPPMSISPHISFTADGSVWDDGEMSFDMVTETDDGAVDEEVRCSMDCCDELPDDFSVS